MKAFLIIGPCVPEETKCIQTDALINSKLVKEEEEDR